jgi:cation transport protein ChaC
MCSALTAAGSAHRFVAGDWAMLLDSFVHVPHLVGKIIEPEESAFRITRAKYDEWDRLARAAGYPNSWRRSHEDREATRIAALAGHLSADLWLFAYASLRWDPAIHFDEIRTATLLGFHRAFGLEMQIGRGSREKPALMAGLREGGQCQGLAFRIPAAVADQETDIVWMREMISDGYTPAFVPAKTAQGDLEALTFIADKSCNQWVDLDEETTARMIATGTGMLGSNLEYLDSLHEHLILLGIDDPTVKTLPARARCIA